MDNNSSETADLLRQLGDLLIYPREDLDREYKSWLNLSLETDKANLAKAILAMANSGGGYVILGFVPQDGGLAPDNENRPSQLKPYVEVTNGIVQSYADPPFHCAVHLVQHPTVQKDFPVVVVPGNHPVPIRTKRTDPQKRHVQENSYYIRKPGPASAAVQSAKEWSDLINRCLLARKDEMLGQFRGILFGMTSPQQPQKTSQEELEQWMDRSEDRWKALVQEKKWRPQSPVPPKAYWEAGYLIDGDIEPLNDLARLVEIIKKATGHESGHPPWSVSHVADYAPYPINGTLESWYRDRSHYDFWRAAPEGRLFLLRFYQEDLLAEGGPKAGTILDPYIHVWRSAECLLHAERFASIVCPEGASVVFQMRWNGLTSRVLKPFSEREAFFWPLEEAVCHQDTVKSEVVTDIKQISPLLPELVGDLLKPLFSVFGFAKIPSNFVNSQISAMRAKAR